MARVYKKKIGGRSYRNWTQGQLNAAIEEWKETKCSLRQVSKKYGIPRNTLWKRIHGSLIRSPGGQTALTPEEENIIVSCVIALVSHGFSVTNNQIRVMIKTYLDTLGRNEKRFKNNIPGKDWALRFTQRHRHELCAFMDQNSSPSCTAFNELSVGEPFDNLEEEMKYIPSEISETIIS